MLEYVIVANAGLSHYWLSNLSSNLVCVNDSVVSLFFSQTVGYDAGVMTDDKKAVGSSSTSGHRYRR